jgi:hypothetical protein
MRYLSVLLAIVPPLFVSRAEEKVYHVIVHVPRQKEIFATLTLFATYAIGGALVVYWLGIMSVVQFMGEFVWHPLIKQV